MRKFNGNCSLGEIEEVSQRARDRGQRVVLTTGCFDVLHVGHIRLLAEARQQGDVLIVGVNDDRSTSVLKGPGRPVHDATSRVEVLSALECVDHVCVFPELDPRRLITLVKPNVFVKGADYEGRALPEEVDVVSNGGKVFFGHYHSGHSTSAILNRAKRSSRGGRNRMKLITGAAGFIGSAMVWKMNTMGIEDVVVVDRLGTGRKWRNLQQLRIGDFVNKDQLGNWLDGHGTDVDLVVHLGACADTRESDGTFLLQNNFEYSKKLWLWCAHRDIPFIYASSAAVYGSGKTGYSEAPHGQSLDPLNPYGFSKLLFDRWVLRQTVAPTMWAGLRFFNVFGPNEYHKGRMASVAFHLFEQHQAREDLKLFKSYDPSVPDGGQARDFVYVKDVVDVIAFLMDQSQPVGILNVGTGVSRTFNDLARVLVSNCGSTADLRYIDMPEDIRGSYQSFTQADISKLRGLGYDQPFRSLEEAISDYVSNYLRPGFLTLGAE